MQETKDDGRIDYVTTTRCAPVVAGRRIPMDGGKPRAGHPLRLFPGEANYYLAQRMIEPAVIEPASKGVKHALETTKKRDA